MKRTILATLTALVASVVVVACGGPSPLDAPSSTPAQQPTDLGPPTASDPGEPSSGGSDHEEYRPPQPQAGTSDEAIASVAAAFIVGFGEFSPFDFDPARDWFARWEMYATPGFLGDMQVGLTNMWQWTWRQQMKAFDVHVTGTPDVKVTADTAVVVVKANRLLLGMNETGDKAREEKLTYTLTMQLNDGHYAAVTQVAQRPGR